MPLVRIRKEVIRVGTYAYQDQKSGELKSLTATPEHIKYWNDTGNAMRADGIPIPTPYEHDPTAHPMTPADMLRNNAGEVQNFEIGKVTENGVVKDALFSWVDVKDPLANDKIKNDTLRWTSPWFTSFTDGNGKKWNGVIGHLALTSRPRITAQQPFQAGFSLNPAKTAPAEITPDGLFLSNAGLVCESQPGVFKPVYPAAFSLWTGVKLAFEEVSEKKETKKEGGDKEVKKEKEVKEGGDVEASQEEEGSAESSEGKKEAAAKFDPMTGEAIKTPMVDPDGDISVWCVVADMLSGLLGVELGDDITEENGLEKVYEILRQAMKEKMAGAATAGEEVAATDTTPPPPTNPIIQEQQPMYMSLEQAQAIQDPTVRSIALSLVESQNESKALKQNAFNAAAATRQKRINAVTRHMGEEEKKELLALAAGAQFSLGNDGVVNDPINQWLTLLEKQQSKLPALLKLNSAEFSVQPQPTETTGAVSDERVKQVREEYRRNAGQSA